MNYRRPSTRSSLAAAIVAGLALCAVAQELPRADADSMEAKIARIESTAEQARGPSAPPVRTSFTERELNAYLQHYGPEFLPAGIAGPQALIGDGGKAQARAIVDLDAVRTARERGWLDPLAFVTGSLEVIATGAVEGADGWGVVRFESATVGGIEVPKTVAQELLRFYTRTPERPSGFEFDKPFELPARIRGVATERGRATVTQ